MKRAMRFRKKKVVLSTKTNVTGLMTNYCEMLWLSSMNISKQKKKFIVWLTATLVILYIFLSIYYSYFSLSNNCFIKIKGVSIASNKNKILEAIGLLKLMDNGSYKNLCKYTDTIIEGACMGSDWHLTSTPLGQDSPACYIQGSKTIYMNPVVGKSLRTSEISDLLKKYSNLSKEFWSSH
jgi:hypothetical protein